MQGFPFDSYLTWDEETHLPSYDRGVSSKPLRNLIGQLFTTGVMPNPSNNLQVHAGTDGMTVVVSPGFAVIEGGLCLEENSRTLAITASDPQFDRIDTVVVRWNENDSARTADLHVVQGVPARNPIRPTLTREGSIYEIGIADIFVTKSVTTITNEKITDTRMESARCGIVSSVSEWDTTTIYQQIQSDLAGFKSNEQAEFMTWFNKMKDQLTTDAAGKLQTEVDDVREQICTNLLNPTAQTKTINGVTFTNNGDGTYTVNGTPTGDYSYIGIATADVKSGYKLVGCPQGGGRDSFGLFKNFGQDLSKTKQILDFGNGAIIDVNESNVDICIIVFKGYKANNVLFKPMLTTDLNATYDDFVPYTGGSGRLNEDVADIFNVFHPIGSLYSTTDVNFNPNTAKGWHGTWERIKDCVIYAAGDSDTVGEIVGSNTHSLTEAELPSHSHSIPALSGTAASAGAHTHKTDWPNWDRLAIHSADKFVGYCYNGSFVKSDDTTSNGAHTHTVTTNASTTGSQGSGTAIDMRPRRLNSIVWRRTA